MVVEDKTWCGSTTYTATGIRPLDQKYHHHFLSRNFDARAVRHHILLSIHDIEFTPSLPFYFIQQRDRHQVWASRISFPPFIPLHRDPQRSQRELEFLFSYFSSSSLIFLLSAECIASMTAKQPFHRTSFHCNNGSCRCLGV